MSNKIKFFYTSSQRLPLLPVVDGQMIFTIDTNIIYLDINGLRLSYNTIKIFDTEDERQNASSLAEGFYNFASRKPRCFSRGELQRWDEYSNKYLMISNKTEWQKTGE